MKLRALRCLLLVAFAVPACKFADTSTIVIPPTFVRDQMEVEVTRARRAFGQYSGVEGYVTNLSDSRVESCTVTFDGLDRQARRIGTASATSGPIEPAGVWSFMARFSEIALGDLHSVLPGGVQVTREK